MAEPRYAAFSEFSGPCRRCGEPAVAPIPLHLGEELSAQLLDWQANRLPGLCCTKCGETFPLAPLTLIYWTRGWVGLVLDGPRTADTILRMVQSWIATPPPGRLVPQSQLVRVFCSVDSLSYALRFDSRSLILDVRSRRGAHWDFELIALTQFLDCALELGEPTLAYAVLAGIIESYPELLKDENLREALELIAHASGPAQFLPDDASTALEHFQRLQSHLPEDPSFASLDSFSIQFETVCDKDTGRPLPESFNGVAQEAPPTLSVCDVCCRVLCGTIILRTIAQDRDPPVEVSHGGEDKSRLQLKALWPSLTANEQHHLSQAFEELTGLDIARVCHF